MKSINWSKWLVVILGAVLLGYTLTRSIDFIQATLPPGQLGAAYFALAALDLGVIAWTVYFIYAARGDYQRTISGGMIGIDLAGVVLLLVGDTLLRAGQNGLIATLPGGAIWWIVVIFSGVIGINVISAVICHLFDPDELKRRAQAEAQDLIEATAIDAIRSQAPTLAAEIAPIISADWIQATKARYLINIVAKQKAAQRSAQKQAAELLAGMDDNHKAPTLPASTTVFYNQEVPQTVASPLPGNNHKEGTK